MLIIENASARQNCRAERRLRGGGDVGEGIGLAGEPWRLGQGLVHAPEGYGLPENYDFVGYFEFAESDAPVFREVMAALRDTKQNPEWKYVLEGPEWWGRRVRNAEAFLARH